jgi:hypothetical protein
MQQHWQKNKSATVEEKQKLVTKWKTKINSLLWRHLKLKQKKNNSKDFVFPSRLVTFLGLVHFLYCTYCVYNVKQKFHENAQHVSSPISWNFSGSFWTESFTICCKEFHESKFCESWMLNKKYFVSITWVFAFYFLKRSYFHETFVKRDWFSVCNKQRFYHFTQHWPFFYI